MYICSWTENWEHMHAFLLEVGLPPTAFFLVIYFTVLWVSCMQAIFSRRK
uniref:Uncharacterized protein n=1 Tax=Arundo donax TaxID=35708 RepID=A0A0A8Y259_ARUDO